MNDLFSPISERSKDSSNNNTASRSLINQNNNNQQLSSLSSAWLPISSNTNFDHSGILLTPLKEEEGEGEGREEEEEDVDWDEHDLYSIRKFFFLSFFFLFFDAFFYSFHLLQSKLTRIVFSFYSLSFFSTLFSF